MTMTDVPKCKKIIKGGQDGMDWYYCDADKGHEGDCWAKEFFQ